MSDFYQAIRPLLFRLSPEFAHDVSFKSLPMAQKCGFFNGSELPAVSKTVFGLTFKNPVGVAAGLDKNADYLDGLLTLGFGFVEVGTVTPKPQPGNPKPRLFRLSASEAIINRMGFNNKGIDYLVERLNQRQVPGLVGVNIGKNKDTPLDLAVEDYLICLEAAYAHCDYITVNLSSPNTPGLRALQTQEYLVELLKQLKNKQQVLNERLGKRKPLLVKIAPDLSGEEVDVIADTLVSQQTDGVIATNTTIDHSAVEDQPFGQEMGGLSGKPLKRKSNQVLSQIFKRTQGKLPIIGVGGITCADDAIEKLNLGADLVQVYSGLIYRGPSLLRDIVHLLHQNRKITQSQK